MIINRKQLPKVYFLGSGNIAVASLAKLHVSERINLVGIGTQMDRPAGRKRKLMPTPVGAWAAENNIEIDKPASVNSEDFLLMLRELNPDIVFVASFGQLLKSELLELPRTACVNLHASLLPDYRGAAPIIAAVLDGISVTGITFMKMDKGLDTGPMYCAFEQRITDERADQLEEKLGLLAAEHVEIVIEKIVSGELELHEQDHDKMTYAEKIKKEDGLLDWNEPAEIIVRKIRAFYPWPGMSFTIETPKKSLRITITEADAISEHSATPGSTITADKNSWIMACGIGAIKLKKVKPEGKGEMSGSDFVRGRSELFKQ
jgi:methionyl-tRNA formyltransferase